MTFDANILVAIVGGLVAAVIYCAISGVWAWRLYVAMAVFGALCMYVGLSGPIRIGG